MDHVALHHRGDKKVSNRNWMSPSDPDSRIARMKDGRTHLAYKAEHAVDLESEIIVAATLHPADQSDAKTLPDTPVRAQANLELAGSETTVEELVADKGYHTGASLEWCERIGARTYIPERMEHRRRRWTDKPEEFQAAVYANRRRVGRAKGRRLQRLRSERVERGFAHASNSGGLRRMTVRGLTESNKRYLSHIAGQNLGIVMRKRFEIGMPREWERGRNGCALRSRLCWPYWRPPLVRCDFEPGDEAGRTNWRATGRATSEKGLFQRAVKPV